MLTISGCETPRPAVHTAAPSATVRKPVGKASAAQTKATPAPEVPVKPGTVEMMPLEQFLPLQQETGKALIYDARPGFVRAFGHIPGSVGWPRSSFASGWAEHESELKAAVAAHKPVVIYCTDLECPDAKFVAGKIAAKGYSVDVLTGGYGAWKEAGLPVE